MVVKTEKSHYLPSTSWRTRKVGDVILSESEGLKIRGANGVNPSLIPKQWQPGTPEVQGQEKMDVPAEAKRVNFLLPPIFLFCLGPQWIRWGLLTFFIWSTNSDFNIIIDTITDTPRNDVLATIWASLSTSQIET